MIHLWVRKSVLDKCLQFSVADDINSLDTFKNNTYYNQWIWFYLGKKLLKFPDLILLPYKITFGNKSILIGKWSGTRSARDTACRIGNKIICEIKKRSR
jgi:hypothetical protein